MTQAAFNQGNMPFGLFGLLGTQAGAGLFGSPQNGNTDVNSAISFQALLALEPSQISSIDDLKKLAQASPDNPQIGEGSSLSYLLSLQSGDPTSQLSIMDKLKQNIASITGTPMQPASSAHDLEGLTEDNLLFLFNAPNSIYGAKGENISAEILSQLSGSKLSTDTMFSLIMQQQNNKLSANQFLQNARKDSKDIDQQINELFSNMILPRESGAELQAQMNELKNELTQLLQSYGGANEANLNQQNTSFVSLVAPLTSTSTAQQASLPKPAAFDLKQAFTSNLKAGEGFTPVVNETAKDAVSKETPQLGILGKDKPSQFKSALMFSSALTPSSALSQANNMSAPSKFDSFLNAFDAAQTDQMLEMDGLLFDDIAAKADMQAISTKANTLINAQQAGQNHPATQNVLQQINLMASRTPKGDSEMRIKLDPPELGNVMIKLKFGKDNSVQAQLSVERPETLAMLQRDAASIQKILQDAGLSVSQDSLSFDLQMGDDGSSLDGSDDNSANPQNSKSSDGVDSNDSNIIETEMTVFIDPATGQKRINMLI